MGWDGEAKGRDTQHLPAKQDGQGQVTKDVEVEDADPWPDAASRKLEAATATCARWSVHRLPCHRSRGRHHVRGAEAAFGRGPGIWNLDLDLVTRQTQGPH